MHVHVQVFRACNCINECSLLTEGILLSFCCVQLCAPTCMWPGRQLTITVCLSVKLATCMLVGSCLATKVFIGNFPAMGRGWVVIK